MTKIHISKDGSPKPCQAAIKCRLGRHFSNEQEAQEYADYLNENSEYIQKRISEHSRNIQNHLNSLEEKSNKGEYKEIVDFIKTTLPNCRDYSESKALVNLVKYANKNDSSKSFNKYQETVAMFNGEKPLPKLQTQEENKRPNSPKRRRIERKTTLPVIKDDYQPTVEPGAILTPDSVQKKDLSKDKITKTLDKAIENSDYNTYVKANRFNEISEQLPNLEKEVLQTRKTYLTQKLKQIKMAIETTMKYLILKWLALN